MGLSSLLSEFRSEADASAVAYRSGQRWISGHAPRVLPEAAGMPVCLRRHGVYLVTGGLGNIGMLMAEYLAEAAGARLVLLGRSAFPDRETWDAWVSEHEVENVTSRKIQRIRDMEKRGAEVFVLSGDVSQRGQMTRIRERIEERFGPVQGVFHAAGLLDGSAFRAVSEMETALYERHFGPKARALFVLRELFGGEMLDFCMLFSSLSTVLGGLGYSAYAAGNSFMDAFAAAENRKGRTFWQSVDWDGWRFDEGEPSVAEPLIMKLAIRPREGRDCFARLLTHATEQHLVVSTGSLRERLERWRTAVSGVGETPDHSEEQRVGSRHQRPNLPTAYEAPGNAMEEEICAIWEELLGIERVGMHDNFFELGGHSLLGTQLLTRVRTELGMDLSLQAIFDHPTIAGMVEAMEQIAADRGGEGFAEAVAQERETVEV